MYGGFICNEVEQITFSPCGNSILFVFKLINIMEAHQELNNWATREICGKLNKQGPKSQPFAVQINYSHDLGVGLRGVLDGGTDTGRSRNCSICPALILYAKARSITYQPVAVWRRLDWCWKYWQSWSIINAPSRLWRHSRVCLCIWALLCVCVLGEFVRQHVSACFCVCICNGIKVCNSSWMIAPLFISKCRLRTEMLWITAFLNMRSGVTEDVNSRKERWH